MAIAAALLMPGTALADAKGQPNAGKALATSQAAIGRMLPDALLRDHQGRDVRLSGYRGRPLVISFVYTSCADTCPIITATLADAVAAARKVLGEDSFEVVTIGFDAAYDTPQRMATFAGGRDRGESRWRFLSGDLATVAAVSDALGFVFYPSAKGFDHLAQVTVVASDGRVYRQIYGETFALSMLVEPLKELVFGAPAPLSNIAALVEKVRLFCTIYDPAAGRYRLDYSLLAGILIGALLIGGAIAFVVRELWWSRRRRGSLG